MILPTAHGVELLLLHQSMPVMELVDLIAFAVRKERSVSRRAPPLKVAFCWRGGRRRARRLHDLGDHRAVVLEMLPRLDRRGRLGAVDQPRAGCTDDQEGVVIGKWRRRRPELVAWSIAMAISRFILADCAA